MSKNPSDLSVATVLALAQERIRDPRNWCKGKLGLDGNGEWTDGRKEGTTQWCARGAIASVLDIDARFGQIPVEPILHRAAAAIYGARVPLDYAHFAHFAHVYVNNYMTHNDVMAVFDRAIEMAIADEKAVA